MTGVESTAGAEDFSSSFCIETGGGAHPAFFPVGTWGSFPGGVKHSQGVMLIRNFMIYTHPQISLGRSSQGE
jgi:hypothetical protein